MGRILMAFDCHNQVTDVLGAEISTLLDCPVLGILFVEMFKCQHLESPSRYVSTSLTMNLYLPLHDVRQWVNQYWG